MFGAYSSDQRIIMENDQPKQPALKLPKLIRGNGGEALWRKAVTAISLTLQSDHLLRGQYGKLTPSEYSGEKRKSRVTVKTEPDGEHSSGTKSESKVLDVEVDGDKTGVTTRAKAKAASLSSSSKDSPAARPRAPPSEEFLPSYRTPRKDESEVITAPAGLRLTQMSKLSLAQLESSLSKRMIFFEIREDGSAIRESDRDVKKRTVLFRLMSESLTGFEHIIRNVDDGDVQAIWSAVTEIEQPEPRDMLISAITKLCAHFKNHEQGYERWSGGLEEILSSLEMLGMDIPDELRLGFHMYLRQKDTRYKSVLERARESAWGTQECYTRFTRRSIDLEDYGRSTNASTSQEVNFHRTKGSQHRSQSARRYGKGGKGQNNGSSPPQTPQKSGKGGKGKGSWSAPEKKSYDNKTQQKGTPPKKGGMKVEDITPRNSNNFSSDKACYSWQQSKACSQGETCRFSHECAMAEQMAPKFEKGQMVNIHKRMTPGFGGGLCADHKYL